MTRTRSEYRLRSLAALPARPTLDARPPIDGDREALARLMLDAYRDTIDDEGEDLDDAREAIDHYFGIIHRDRSLVVEQAGELVAACFVLDVEGITYIDPIVVATSQQRSGLGGRLVLAVLHGLPGVGGVEASEVEVDSVEISEVGEVEVSGVEVGEVEVSEAGGVGASEVEVGSAEASGVAVGEVGTAEASGVEVGEVEVSEAGGIGASEVEVSEAGGVGASEVEVGSAEASEVGATITDGNTPSERLFARLGFERVGAWN